MGLALGGSDDGWLGTARETAAGTTRSDRPNAASLAEDRSGHDLPSRRWGRLDRSGFLISIPGKIAPVTT